MKEKEQPDLSPHTMLKKEDWGGLTILNLLAVFAFPPYFVYLMTMAALTASGYLWTTRLSRIEQERFIEFEKEFRAGYKLGKAGRTKEALSLYHKLQKKYSDSPQAVHLLTLQIDQTTKGKSPAKEKHPEKASSPKMKPPRG